MLHMIQQSRYYLVSWLLLLPPPHSVLTQHPGSFWNISHVIVSPMLKSCNDSALILTKSQHSYNCLYELPAPTPHCHKLLLCLIICTTCFLSLKCTFPQFLCGKFPHHLQVYAQKSYPDEYTLLGSGSGVLRI